jgi:hypothetical protein
MIVKVKYSNSELEAAVKFISKNNKRFRGKDQEIQDSIIETIRRLAISATPGNETYTAGTLGYVVNIVDVYLESIDSDENIVLVEILVNPALGNTDWSDSDNRCEMVDIPLDKPKDIEPASPIDE